MAGIAGWVARRARDDAALGAMAAALAHRARPGQALEGVCDADARRQAVLGATLRDPACGISLVLDGALANAAELRTELAWRGFAFPRGDDEEVLLRAYQYWDKDALRRLRGPFSLALWDPGRERLLLARDRFGEKPLYLGEANGALYFASEPKALLAAGLPAKVNLAALRECLGQRYVSGPNTLFAGVRKLAPASYALWQFGRLHEARYWVAPDAQPHVPGARSADPVEGFLSTLHEAVKLHAADGVFLSGGVDSAVLVALMALDGARPRTFSLGFEGERGGELAQAARVARHFDTLHQEIVISPRELPASLPRLVALRDAPVARPSDLAVHRLACEAARSARIVLTGDGSDEILGGYRRYVAEIHGVPMRLFSPLVRAGRFDSAAGPAQLERWRRRLLGPAAREALEASAEEEAPRGASALRCALYRDQTSWLPDQVLERNERAAASAALDARMPFVDHRVAEYVSALPDAARLRGLATKRILRAAARRVLPRPLAHPRKGGWRIDAAGWLRNELRELTREHLQAGSCVTRAYYNAAALDRAVADHLQGKKNHESLIWTLLNIEIWHRTYRPG